MQDRVTCFLKLFLRWLDGVFHDEYLSSLSLNYVAINKDLEKSPVDTTAVLDNDENLFWSRLPWHRSCYSNEITPLTILLAAVFLGTGTSYSKIVHGSFLIASLRFEAPHLAKPNLKKKRRLFCSLIDVLHRTLESKASRDPCSTYPFPLCGSSEMPSSGHISCSISRTQTKTLKSPIR